MQSVLDEMGAEPGSTVMTPQGEFVVARPEAVYLYTAEGRGPCFVFSGVTDARIQIFLGLRDALVYLACRHVALPA